MEKLIAGREERSYRHIKNVDQLCLSVLEVFDYLPSKYTSKAHVYNVSLFALLLDGLKLSKFQIPDISKKAFSYSMVSIYIYCFNSLALVLLVLFAKIVKYFGSRYNTIKISPI